MSWRSIWSFLTHHPLTSRHRGAAAARFLRWQVVSRLRPKGVVVPFVGEARLLVRSGMTGATGNVYAGLHDFEDMAFLLHALRPSDLFVDIGANVGSYTILAAKVVGARCIAVEPVLRTHQALKDNVHLNGVQAQVDLVQQALGREPGQVRMTASKDAMNHVATNNTATFDAAENTAASAAGRTELVSLTTLDALLAGRSPFLLKIDVEGFEFDVLSGAERTLDDPSLKGIILEENNASARFGRSDAACQALLTAKGFRPLTYCPRTRGLGDRDPSSRAANVLYVRDRPQLEQRLKEASTFTVLGQAF